MPPITELIRPYEASLAIAVAAALATIIYARGLVVRRRLGERTGILAPAAYFLGVGLMYVVMHTHVDYLAQYMFWVHRAQHLVLHHLGPFLVVLAMPAATLAAGLPAGLRDRLVRPVLASAPVRLTYRGVQHPAIAPVLFVGLIYYWLTPSIHFDAMLSRDLYQIMNWSMVIDGLLFWWLIVDPRGKEDGGLGFGIRIIMLWAIMLPQIAIGAYLGLARVELYSVYDVCGRAWPIDPLTDQQLGGLITWIPACMMSVLGALVVLRHWLRGSDARDERPDEPPAHAREPMPDL